MQEWVVGTIPYFEAERARAENREFIKSQQPEAVRDDIKFRQKERETMTVKTTAPKAETKKGDRNRPALYGGLATKRGQVLAPIRVKGYELWQGGEKSPIVLRTRLQAMFPVKLPKSTVRTWCARWVAGKVPDSYEGDGGKVHDILHETVHQNGSCTNCLETVLVDLERLLKDWPNDGVNHWLQGVRIGMKVTKR